MEYPHESGKSKVGGVNKHHLAADFKNASQQIHAQLESHPWVKKLFKGAATLQEYKSYLLALKAVYEALEQGIVQYQSYHPETDLFHQLIDPAYFRKDAIQDDLETLHHIVQSQLDIVTSAGVLNYRQRIVNITKDNPILLVAHAYVRYLGDLSGGQMLKQKLEHQHQYQFPVAFYEFNNLKLSSIASSKLHFRDTLNEIEISDLQKNNLVQEVVKAFELNKGLFDELVESVNEDK